MTGVAVVIIRREKALVALFRQARAVAPERAQSPGALGAEEGGAFSRLRRRAILRESATGQFYLDEPAWEAFQLGRRRLLLLLCVIGLGLGSAWAVVEVAHWWFRTS